jgi:AraC-like DNA-binding protein
MASTTASGFATTTELVQLAKAAKYNARAFAELCGYARDAWQLRREFRRRFRCSPRTWLNQARIKEAEARLLAGETPKEMFSDLGFVDLSHLSHSFRHVNGNSPSQFVSLQASAGE